ncbi:MAG: hypothetical protein WBA13_20655 [Microcoleaceae cyanobacterium]
MAKRLKIEDLDNFQEDLSSEFAARDLSIIQGGMLAETTDSIAIKEVSLESDERLIAYPLPEPEPIPIPSPWPPYPIPCGCSPYPIPFPEKPIKGGIFLPWCPVIL